MATIKTGWDDMPDEDTEQRISAILDELFSATPRSKKHLELLCELDSLQVRRNLEHRLKQEQVLTSGTRHPKL